MPNLPLAEGGKTDGGGPNWLLIGGAGLGVVVLIILMSKGTTASSGTTAGQTSINAALGSVQEENLNIMGQMGQFEQRLNGQLGNLNDNVIAGQDLTVKNGQVNFYTSNEMAARVLQQEAAARGDSANAQAWTDYLNNMIPALDQQIASAWKLPTAAPVGNSSVTG